MNTAAQLSGAAAPTTALKYWAFICYRPADAGFAQRLHGSLETFRVPKPLVGTIGQQGAIPDRAFPIFLDSAELPLRGRRGEDLEFALEQSRFLIVICSGQAGDWSEVDEQIRHFQSLGRGEKIICYHPAGRDRTTDFSESVDESLPPAVRAGTGPTESLASAEPILVSRSKSPTLEILAHLLGVGFDDLYQRDAWRVHRRRQVLLTGSALLFLIYALLGMELFTQKRRAKDNEIRAIAEAQEARHQQILAQKARAEAEEKTRAAKAELERLKQARPKD